MEREPNTEYILSLSYGKDSLACLFAIEQLGWPLDRITHAEVWATDTIPADPPPMVEFKSKADQIIKERWGIEVEHRCAMKNGEKLTYEKLFYHVPNRKPETLARYEGGVRWQITGFPFIQRPWCNGHLKIPALRISLYNRELVQKAQGRLLSMAIQSPSIEGTGVPNSKPKQSADFSGSGGVQSDKRSQNEPFPKAPLHKERRKILCSTSALRLTSLNALPDTKSRGSCCRSWKLVGTKPTVANCVKKMICSHRSTLRQQGAVVGFVTTKALTSSVFSARLTPIYGRCS